MKYEGVIKNGEIETNGKHILYTAALSRIDGHGHNLRKSN